MSGKHRIQRISVSQTGGHVRAEARVTIPTGTFSTAVRGGEEHLLSETVTVEETAIADEPASVTYDRALAKLRQRLYAAGIPKRAIATAVNEFRERKE
jgi:hypothetical protein